MEKRKGIIVIISAAILGQVIAYGIFVFCLWQPDASKWGDSKRGSMIGVGLCTTAMLICAVGVANAINNKK